MQKMKLNLQLFASGTIDGSSTASNCDCRIVWSSTKNDSNNTSTVTATVQIKKSGSSSTSGTFSGTITIDGTSYSISKYDSWKWGDWRTVGSATKIVTHNADGSKNVNISTSLKQTGTSMAGTYSASGSATLDKINRASKLSEIEDFKLTDTITININKYITAATDKLQIKLGDTLVKEINNITTGYELTFTTAEQTTIKNLMTSPQATLIFLLTTINGETTLGTSTQSATITSLDKPIFRNVIKKENGHYQVAINGVVNNEAETFQVYDDAGNDLLFYQKGDVYENDYYLPVSGHITNATKNVCVTLVLPKRLDNITSITCNKLNCEARGLKGYLNSQAGYVNYVDKSGYTVSCRKNSNCSVEIRIAKSTAFTNVDNNTPITLALGENKGDITLTFN